jgi:hypothetical protein
VFYLDNQDRGQREGEYHESKIEQLQKTNRQTMLFVHDRFPQHSWSSSLFIARSSFVNENAEYSNRLLRHCLYEQKPGGGVLEILTQWVRNKTGLFSSP